MKIILIACLVCALGHGADAALAAGLSKAGIEHFSSGRLGAAEECLLRALSYDEQCREALLALGKLYDKRGQRLDAASFYRRATSLLDGSEKIYAQSRLAALDPYYGKIENVLAEYKGSILKLRETSGTEAVKAIDGQLSALGVKFADTGISFSPAGQWRKEGYGVINIKDNHTLEMDGVTGKWKASGTIFSIDYDRFWGHKDCTIVDADTFNDGHHIFTRIKP